MGLPLTLVSVLILTTATLICEGVVYVPTIVNACVYRAGDSYRLNVRWKFEENVNSSRIEGFTITFTSLEGRSLLLYQYRPGSLNGIETDGRTYVRNIPLSVVRNNTMIAVYITINDTVHPQSQLFRVERCTTRDTTSTTTVVNPITMATTTTTLSSSSSSLTTTTTTTSITTMIIPSTSSTQSTMTTLLKTSSIMSSITLSPSSAVDLVYEPTIVSACVYKTDDASARLNVQWKFEDDIDTSQIEGFTVVLGRRVLYQYKVDNNSTIETDGRTYVRNIPLPDITDAIRVSVYITINGIVHPQSKPVTIETCIIKEINTTSVSTVVKTPIRSSTTILPSSTKVVSTTMILSTQEVMPTTSNIIPKNTPTGIEVYVPTITSACIDRSNGMHRLNIQWMFGETTDLKEIDEFIVYYLNSTMFVEVYHYPDDDNTDVTVVGKTSASNIPLPEVTSTMIKVRIASVANRAVNPPSEMFNTTECSTGELNPTTITTTSTTISSITTTTTTTATTTTTTATTTTATTAATTTTIPTNAGNVQSVLVSNLPTSSTAPLSTLSPTPSSPTSLSNTTASNDSNDFPIIVVVIAVAIICVLLLLIMIVLIIFIVRLKYKSRKNKDSESEAESVKPLQNGSLLFRQADKVNYLKTSSQVIDSQYNTVQKQSDNNESTSNQNQRYSEAHKYDVPANNRVANNDYDHIDFQYEQADHPFQQSYTNGGPHVTNYEEGPQQKYNVLVHSSSMDKLGKDCPNPPSISTDHYNKLHDNTCVNTNQTHLNNGLGEAYYSVPVNSTLSANNANAIKEPHDYDRLSEKP